MTTCNFKVLRRQITSKMSHKIEQRKNAFKAENIPHSGDRIRKQTEQLRKDKRSANVLAKRLKTDTSVDAAESSASANYTKEYVTEAITKINVILSLQVRLFLL